MAVKVDVFDSKDTYPVCPHCEAVLQSIARTPMTRSFFTVTERYVYSCPSCFKVLGIGQSAWV